MPLFVSYCQYEVGAGHHGAGLAIYTVGDDLVHVGGPGGCTGFTGVHTDSIEMRAVVADTAPADGGQAVPDAWEAVSETSLWCPAGQLSVVGLMGDAPAELSDLPVPRGLVRVQVRARRRIHESIRTDGDPPEQHEIVVWPVAEETGQLTLRTDTRGHGWKCKPAEAAEWAMLDLALPPTHRPHVATDPDQDQVGLPRVAVVRRRIVPATTARALLADPAGVLVGEGTSDGGAADHLHAGERALAAGDLEVRLRTVASDELGCTLTWQWATAAVPVFPEPLTTVPDAQPSTVHLCLAPSQDADSARLTVRHAGVLGRHAVTLGLIWDHLLDRLAEPQPLAWQAALHTGAAEAAARAQEHRQRQAAQEALRWGGAAPTDRLRQLSAHHGMSLAQLHRPLLDHLAALPADRQREIACWAARRAAHVAGLEGIGWIADALSTVEAGGALPPAWRSHTGHDAFRRLLSDPQLPDAVTTLHGASNCLLAAIAFPAMLALAHQDPLAAAVDAVYTAILTHGDDHHHHFLTEVETTLGTPPAPRREPTAPPGVTTHVPAAPRLGPAPAPRDRSRGHAGTAPPAGEVRMRWREERVHRRHS